MKQLKLVLLVLCLCAATSALNAQEKYYPNGNPDKWNVQVNPYMWLPAISGKIESLHSTKELTVPGIDLISNLKMAFFINAEVSKGKLFFTPSYTYTKVGTDKQLFTAPNGKEVSVAPDLTLNIFGLNVGLHEAVSKKLIIDPYLGVRYNNFKTTMELTGLMQSENVEQTADFTDPLIGLRILYFPHPRVPVIFSSDVGGFGIGSDYSWTGKLDAGYSLSPQVDLIAGFSAYGMKFTGEPKSGSPAELKLIMYGVNLGIRILLPRRVQDASVFKKFGK